MDGLQEVYDKVIPNTGQHDCCRIIPCPSSPLINYTLRNFKGGENRFKEQFQRVLEKEKVEMVLAAFLHAVRFGTRYLRQGDPGITQTKQYRALTQLLHPKGHTLVNAFLEAEWI